MRSRNHLVLSVRFTCDALTFCCALVQEPSRIFCGVTCYMTWLCNLHDTEFFHIGYINKYIIEDKFMCVPSIAFNLCSDLVKDIPVQGLDDL